MSVALKLNNFTFNSEEFIKDRCAEVFLTNHGRFVLNCMSCYEMFHNFELFKQHVNEDHATSDISIIDEEDTTADSFETKSNIVDNVNEIKTECITNEEFWTILPTTKSNDDSTEERHNDEFQANNDDLSISPDMNLDDIIVEDDILDEKDFITISEIENDQSSIGSVKTNSKPKSRQGSKRRIRPNNSNSERIHVCPICSFAFADKSNLNSHIKRHGNEKKHQCTECPKRFFSRTELETHMRWHTGERPYICSSCGKGCLTSGDLTVHERRHTNDRRYKCSYCEKSFFNNKHLKDHTLSHTQERNFECEICHSRFLRRKSLLSHIKIHENKREYVCNICGNAYNQKPALSIHIKSKHGVYLHKKDDENP